MQIKEPIASIIDFEEKHEDNCPWHEKKETQKKDLPIANAEEDGKQFSNNDSGLLGGKLKPRPSNGTVTLQFKATPMETYWPKTKTEKIPEMKWFVNYVDSEVDEPYEYSFAAHHLIPGNAALKGHPILRFVGADNVLGEYKGNVSSELAADEFIGYDINSATNGIWLPGPYPLSTAGKWTIKAKQTKTTKRFKFAYASQVMDQAGRQFHYCHTKYSDFIVGCLDKLYTIVSSCIEKCPELKHPADPPGPPPKPYKAPYGLVAKLDRISYRMRPYLDGTRWSRHIYTDNDAGKDYIPKELRMFEK